jgi:ribonuclease VapC
MVCWEQPISPESSGKMVHAELDVNRLRESLTANGVGIEPLIGEDAEPAGARRSLDGGRSLSLGDRCCLALTARSQPPEVLTADQAWAELDLPIRIRLLR